MITAGSPATIVTIIRGEMSRGTFEYRQRIQAKIIIIDGKEGPLICRTQNRHNYDM